MIKFPVCRARLGWVVPHLDSITEPLLAQLLPDVVFFHVMRMHREGPLTPGSLRVMTSDELDRALKQIPAEPLDLIVYHCTSGSVVVDPEVVAHHITDLTHTPAITTSMSVIEQMRELGVRRLSLVTPYVSEINNIEKGFLEKKDFQVIKVGGREMCDGKLMQQVTPAEIAQWAVAADSPDVDAIFISCTGLRSVECAETLASQLRKPIITSTGATIWYALGKIGVESPMLGCQMRS